MSPQSLQHLYLHEGELWVEIAFSDFIELGDGITDSNNDGWREVFGRIPNDYYSSEVYNQLVNAYVAPVVATLGLRDMLSTLLENLYSDSWPVVVSALGAPYTHERFGTLQHPTAVIRHSNATLNVLLVVP
jgi:hypothetical protein